jgi:hypothetical protein
LRGDAVDEMRECVRDRFTDPVVIPSARAGSRDVQSRILMDRDPDPERKPTFGMAGPARGERQASCPEGG